MAERQVSTIVPLRGGANYATWKVQCTMALKKDGLWTIVSGSEEPPADDADEKVKERFAERKDKALATVVLSVDPSLLYLIGDPVDPVAVWQKLEEQFQKKSWVNRLNLRRRLHSLKLKDGDSVQGHVKMMLETFNELTVVGDAITDEDRVVFLLASLPESFSTLVTALESNATVPEMDTVIERLMHEERKRKDRHGDDFVNDGALTARSKNTRPKGPKCYSCQRFGHIQRNCPERTSQASSTSRFPDRTRAVTRKGKKGTRDEIHRTVAETNEIGLVTLEALSAVSSCETETWIIDSGATCHICNDRRSFVKINTLKKPQAVTLGDGHSLSATETGDVTLELVYYDGKTRRCRLQNVLYVPKLAYNLLSVSKATETGKKIKFYSDDCEILDEDNKTVAVGVRKGNLYYLNCRRMDDRVNMSDAKLPESKEFIWHRRFGHLNERSLQTLASQQLVCDFDYHLHKSLPFCKSCVEGKLHRTPFPKGGRKRADVPLGLVHSDVCGPLGAESLSGARYFVTFLDDKTHYTWVYFLKSKDEVFSKFLEWKCLVERTSGSPVKSIRTDNGGEYTSTEFSDYLKREGIRHELTVPKNPEQNGVAERLNRTLVESVRSMLSDAQLPQKFWAEALSTAVFLKNRSSTSSLPGMTPFKAWSGKKPSVKDLRVFGCAAYSHIPKDERKKLQPKATRCIFLGYGDVTKGYRLYNPTKHRVIHSRDVVFNENSLGVEKEQGSSSNSQPLIDFNLDMERQESEDDPHEETNREGEEPAENEQEMNTESAEDPPPVLRRSQRVSKRPDYYGTWIYSTKQEDTEPTTVQEAMSSPDQKLWKEAMKKEMESIERNRVWRLVKLPKGKKAIGCKWVFKRKIGPDGFVTRFKARLVAKGCSQQYGTDYDETFSPVARFESLRTLLALATQDGLRVHQMDVTTAFLNGELKEEVYMAQPEEFAVPGKEHLVCQLKHSLYGLKQAPRCWNSVLDKVLKEMGFVQSASDPCIYIARVGEPFLIGVYVDDMLLAGKSEKRINEIKSTLSRRFDMKDLGELNHFLGVQVEQNHENGTTWIGQPMYTESILKRFGMESCKQVATPVEAGGKLNKGTEDSEHVDKSYYQSVVGSLLYLSTRTRPDITFAVGLVARFCSDPTSQHLTAVKRILRYLRGTTHHGLLFRRSESSAIVGYSDADWGGDRDDSKSTTGYLFQIGGTAISWQSKKQSCVALSTAEAEYVALSAAAQEAVWLKQLNQDLTNTVAPIKIYEDNQSAIAIAKNPQFHGRVKHISIKYHFIREQVNSDNIMLKYCQTSEMIADMLTKGLGKLQFEKLREMAGVLPLTVCK